MLRAEILMMVNGLEGFKKCNRNVYLREQNDRLNHNHNGDTF